MQILKQSTAATIKLGPFVDSGDGSTAETGLTISQADIRLSKNGGDIAQTNNATGATHDELGYYDVPLDTTDTGTLGRLQVMVHESGALPVWQEFLVVPANVYDSLVSGSDVLQADVTQWLGTAAATPRVAGYPEVFEAQSMRTHYVATSGGNDSAAGTRAAPLATVAQAVTNASTGDTIHLLAGSHTVTSVSTTKRLNWRGDRSVGPGTVSEMTSSTSDTFITGNGSTVENLKISNTLNNSAVIACNFSGRFDITLRNVVVDCTYGQGLFHEDATGLVLDHCTISGVEFGVQQSHSTAVVRDSSITATQRAWGMKNSTLDSRGGVYTGQECGMYIDNYDGYYSQLIGVSDVYKGRNTTATPISAGARDFLCGLYLETDAAELVDGIQTPIHCTNCLFIAEATHADFPADVAGIYHDTISDDGRKTIVLIGGQVHIENAGDGTSRHFWLDNDSHMVIVGTNYDPALCQGDIIDVPLKSAAILVDTAELQTDWTNGGRLDLLIDATLADTNELQTDLTNGGRLDLILDATLADTNELQTDLANGGRVDLLIDAILEDTGTSIPATLAGITGTALQTTTIATLASQTSFTLTAGSADNDAYNDAIIIVTDASTSTQKAVGYISDYVGSTKTVTLGADPGIFTMATGDSVTIIAADKGLLADVAAISTTPDTRDLEPVAHANTWKMVQRAGGVVSVNTITIYQGETKRIAFDCSGILGNGEVLASMSSLTGSVANLTGTEVGIDPKNAKADMACGSGVAAGTYNLRTTITTSADSGPILLIGTVIVVED